MRLGIIRDLLCADRGVFSITHSPTGSQLMSDAQMPREKASLCFPGGGEPNIVVQGQTTHRPRIWTQDRATFINWGRSP